MTRVTSTGDGIRKRPRTRPPSRERFRSGLLRLGPSSRAPVRSLASRSGFALLASCEANRGGGRSDEHRQRPAIRLRDKGKGAHRTPAATSQASVLALRNETSPSPSRLRRHLALMASSWRRLVVAAGELDEGLPGRIGPSSSCGARLPEGLSSPRRSDHGARRRRHTPAPPQDASGGAPVPSEDAGSVAWGGEA